MNSFKKTLFVLFAFATQTTFVHGNISITPPTVNSMIAQYELTPLMIACYNGDVERVERLLESPNTDINATDTRGLTALMYACFAGAKNTDLIVALLLSHGATIKAKTTRPFSALDFATLNENQVTIDLILKRAQGIEEAIDATHYNNEFRYNSFAF